MNEISGMFLKNNFYYCYLKGRLEKAAQASFCEGVLIVGSSHSLAGIDETVWNEAVNCSMHSQDIYYDSLCIRSIISNINSQICRYKTCILVMGYYMPTQDLSLSLRARKEMIIRTYYPIFKDAHNWAEPDLYDHWQGLPSSSDSEKEVAEHEAIEYSKNIPFYSEASMVRKPLFDFGGLKWDELDEEKRVEYGNIRAQAHARLMEHKGSYPENCSLLRQIMDLLHDKLIDLKIVVTPFSKEYESAVLPEQKELFYKMIKESGVSEVINYNHKKYTGYFDESDFMDADHLNLLGCRKFSELLKEEVSGK